MGKQKNLENMRENMKKSSMFVALQIALAATFLVGCHRSTEEVWDDTRSATRYVGRGLRALGGKHGDDSRQIRSKGEFSGFNEDAEEYSLLDEYIPLIEKEENTLAKKGNRALDAKNAPSLKEFKDPKDSERLAEIFRNIHFSLDSDKIRGDDNLKIVKGIADYMKKQNNAYLCIEGHCDERGAQAYNLALGTRRSNTVRSLLVKEGVDPERIQTVSYGKERPLAKGHTEESFKKNRRAEFKIYHS